MVTVCAWYIDFMTYDTDCVYVEQGNKEDYERCVTAAREAWNTWADVSGACN